MFKCYINKDNSFIIAYAMSDYIDKFMMWLCKPLVDSRKISSLLFTFVLLSLRLILHPAWQALMYILLSEPQTGEYLT